jgi:membrane protein DedA with SNARE-associated domain
MLFLDQVEQMLQASAQVVPMEVYVALGTFVEEVLAPIPSPVIMTLAGSLAAASSTPVWYLMVLGLIGAATKTFASLFLYWIGDKAEDFLVNRFGKYVGVSNKEIEKIGTQFNGNNRDVVVLILARAVPIMPTSPVSVVCGVIKMDLKKYIVGTFIGTWIRGMMYLLLGYYSVDSLEKINQGLMDMESLVQIGLVAIIGLVFVIMFYKRGKQQNLLQTIKSKFGVK